MRQAIVDGISALSLGTFVVSTELPWDAAGTPLYLKNFKVFYISEPGITSAIAVPMLSSGSINTQETRIQVFVTVDAKQKPTNYNDLVTAVQDVVYTTDITGVLSREVDVITTFENDALITEFEFRYTELKLN